MDKTYPIGKLPTEDLDRLLQRYAHLTDPRILVGPGIGQDATVISFGSKALVVKSDPITFATERIGWYAVNINANDIAAMGASPKWFMATLLLPEKATTPALVERIFSGLADACMELGVTLCGGHTEISYGLTRPLIVGHMLGETDAESVVSAAGALIGDDIILTKGIAIEGTALIAMEKAALLEKEFSFAFLETCRNYLQTPGLSVVKDARFAMETGGVHAMHDPTEGGLATGLRELAMAAGVGLLIDADRIPLLPEAKILCDRFGLDPMGTIASGALIIASDPTQSPAILSRLSSEGISASVIGTAREPQFGVKLRRDGTIVDLPTFNRDEVGKVFETTE